MHNVHEAPPPLARSRLEQLRLYGVADLAWVLNLGPGTVRKLICVGEIPPELVTRSGKRVRFTWEQVAGIRALLYGAEASGSIVAARPRQGRARRTAA